MRATVRVNGRATSTVTPVPCGPVWLRLDSVYYVTRPTRTLTESASDSRTFRAWPHGPSLSHTVPPDFESGRGEARAGAPGHGPKFKSMNMI